VRCVPCWFHRFTLRNDINTINTQQYHEPGYKPRKGITRRGVSKRGDTFAMRG